MSARSIAEFQIEAEAASGATGTVYQAVDPATGARVAVKVMRGLAGADAVRFGREASLLARVRHPGVVRYVGHGTTGEGEAYLVMEWLHGEDLRARLRRAGLSVDETLALGRRVAEALGAIHALGLVHRDIKPANVFLPDGQVTEAKIVDFGLARSESPTVELTRAGMVVGTPSYMSPEQARGQRGIDARADVFSLGCVLFRCLAGRAPFEGSTPLAVLTKVLLEEPPRLRDLRPEVPAELEALIARMLAKAPSLRPESAVAVAEALAAIDPVGDTGEHEVPVPPSRGPAGITGGEQRITGVILAGDLAPEADVAVVVRAHGGQVDSLLDGTRVITLPVHGVATDQAARAARCALALHDAFPGTPLVIATGFVEVDHGPVDPRTSGPRPRSGVERGGDVVERAAALLLSRREHVGGEIALDETTAALLGPRFAVNRDDAGLTLVGASAALSAPTLLGRATPTVGRDWELGSIRTLFESCLEERDARSLLVTGAPGMGKSRLAHEAVAVLRAVAPDLLVWWAVGDPMRSGSGLGLLGQLVRSAAGDTAGDAPRERVLEGLRPLLAAPDTTWMAEALADVVGADLSTRAAARTEARILYDQRRAAWEGLVAGATAARPLLLVIEDAQWADGASIRVLAATMREQAGPTMALLLGRPEVREALAGAWEGDLPQEIRLGPLPRRAAERLVRAALPDAGPDTVQRLVAQADGNAFYLEELVRAVSTMGASPEASRSLPPTVLAMVHERLEGLDAATRRVLRAASVFGEVFWAGGVGALLGGTQPVGGWAEDLVAREILVSRTGSRFPGERELCFRHALLREGAYAMLTEGDRVLGHALAGRWLEEHGEADAMVLARHFEAARDEARAALHLRTAAGQALRAADVDEAIARAERALSAATSETARIEHAALLAEAHAWRDAWGRAAGYADEVVSLSPPGSAVWIRAMSWKQSAALIQSRADQLLPAIMALATVEGEPGTGAELVSALATTVFVLGLGGQTAMVSAMVARIDSIVASEAPSDPRLLGAAGLAHTWDSAWGQGDAWTALRHARTASAAAEAAHDTRHLRFTRIFVAMCLWQLGLHAEANAELPPEAADAGDLPGVVTAIYRSIFIVDHGLLDEARRLAERRIALAGNDPLNSALRVAEGHWILGEVAAREGDLEAADRELTASLDPLYPTLRSWQAAAARLVLVRLARGRVAEAAALDRALQESLAAGGYGLRGTLVKLAHVEVLRASGEEAAAHAALREAWTDLEARASRIDDSAVRRAFLENVPEHARVAALFREWLGG